MGKTDLAVDVAAELAVSDSRTVYRDVPLDHPTRVRLALEHDIHSVWDAPRKVWSFSKGVPEEQVMTYHALSDSPAVSDDAEHPYPAVAEYEQPV